MTDLDLEGIDRELHKWFRGLTYEKCQPHHIAALLSALRERDAKIDETTKELQGLVEASHRLQRAADGLQARNETSDDRILDLEEEIARLTERCSAYKGQVEAGASKIARLKEAKRAPVQGYSAGIPWDMHLRAYDAYCKKHSPQPALIEGWCRGGFGTGELDDFIPGWRDELDVRKQLAARIARLEKALTFYATKENWAERTLERARAEDGGDPTISIRHGPINIQARPGNALSKINKDSGGIARAALSHEASK